MSQCSFIQERKKILETRFFSLTKIVRTAHEIEKLQKISVSHWIALTLYALVKSIGHGINQFPGYFSTDPEPHLV
jgi:hypothetical protein